MFTKIKIAMGISLMVGLLITNLLPGAANAQSNGVSGQAMNQLKSAGEKGGAGYGAPTDPRITAALIVRAILNFLGIIFFCLIIYAGILWMTAGGNDEQIGKAKKLMYRSVIGLIIVLSAYSITWLAMKIAFNYTDDPYGAGVKTLPYFEN